MKATPLRRDAVLDRTFAALAHPARRAILTRLAHGEVATVSALASPFDMSVMAVSKHLRQMEAAGLVRRRRVGREQRCSLDPHAFDVVRDWLEEHRGFWTGALASLARFVERAPDHATLPGGSRDAPSH